MYKNTKSKMHRNIILEIKLRKNKIKKKAFGISKIIFMEILVLHQCH
jgi:hypothetical protein